MKSSLTFVVPSAIAILSTTLLCGLSGYGSVANRDRRRHPASQHHGRSAEASGEATEAGAGGNSCISPGSANPSNATASARFSTSEACGA
jgi:hypothetical protein